MVDHGTVVATASNSICSLPGALIDEEALPLPGAPTDEEESTCMGDKLLAFQRNVLPRSDRGDKALVRQCTWAVQTQDAVADLTKDQSPDAVVQTLEDMIQRIKGGDGLRHRGHAAAAIASLDSVKKMQRRKTKELSMQDKESLEMDESDTVAAMLPKDWLITGLLAFISIAVVVILSVWSANGLMDHHENGHVVMANSRQGHIFSPVFATPAHISLHGTRSEYFEVRLVMAGYQDFGDDHRRLAAPSIRKLAQAGGGGPASNGSLTYELLADGEPFFSETLALAEGETEHFAEVDVVAAGKNLAKHFSINVTAVRADGSEVPFLCQVLQMASVGKHRQIVGIVIFVITFIGIVSEKIHRSYSAFLGSACALCAMAGIMETPHLHNITAMIDFGTLMLLFSMMILMRMLALTGFFNWMSVKVVIWSKQNPKYLFFILSNLCGWLSMILDNVTCVLLFGPLVFSLAEKMELNPRPLYLAMTICATVGGTATQIGDPPNIVIGSMTKIGFEKFIICNLPLVGIFLLPLSSILLWYRLKDKLILSKGKKVELDMVMLEKENRITDPPMFSKLMAVLFGVLLALILSPVHMIEPPWFTVMAMFGCAIMFETHHFGHYLEFVEWDTLLFFALLFVLVETLAELGVIRLLGDGVVGFIKLFPADSRMSVAIITILWVSSIGSAFLESLPFTTVITYMLIDLTAKDDITGVDPKILVWPLSVGACIGGIGSIMGSSANLVCMAVSNRFGTKEEEKVQGVDFLKYGLPVLLVLTVVAMIWQLVLFVAIGYKP